MFKRFRTRIHESVALAALMSGALTLHVAWIDNLLITRSETLYKWFNLIPEIGPITGLYADTLGAFVLFFILFAGLWQGKDCSHWRDRVFWFFIASILVFLVMTLPFVYEFHVS